MNHADNRQGEETPEQKESRLRQSAWYCGGRMVEGKDERDAALERMCNTVPGFPHERYDAELDAALAGIAEAQVGVRERRQKRITEARGLDLLNTVFELHHFNRRFARHVGEYGLGEIDLDEALGDLYSVEQIEEAKSRASELLSSAARIGYEQWDLEASKAMESLRLNHPGFRRESLSHALQYGWWLGR
jgi:hypothetical protein